MTKQKSAIDVLHRRRREAETKLEIVQTSLKREVGWAPITRTWLLPLMAFACGIAIAGWRTSARKRRESP